MGVVDEAVQNCIGVGGVTNDGMPVLHGQLAGDDGRSPAVSLLEDFQKVIPSLGIERFQAPVIQDEELHIAQGAADAIIPAITARQHQFTEQFRHALIQHRAVITAGFVAKRAGQPAFADPGWTVDHQIFVRIDPVAGNEFLE